MPCSATPRGTRTGDLPVAKPSPYRLRHQRPHDKGTCAELHMPIIQSVIELLAVSPCHNSPCHNSLQWNKITDKRSNSSMPATTDDKSSRALIMQYHAISCYVQGSRFKVLYLSNEHSYSVVLSMKILCHRLLQQCNTKHR